MELNPSPIQTTKASTTVTDANSTPSEPSNQTAEESLTEVSIAPSGIRKLLALAIVAIATIRIIQPMDLAMTNALTAMISIITLSIYFVWLIFRSNLTKTSRKKIGFVGCLAAITAVAVFKITAVNGFLIPTIQLRWSVAPDQNLASITDELPEQSGNAQQEIALGSSSGKYDFPQFLGPERHPRIDNAIWDSESLSAGGISELWRHPIGAGWSAYAAVSVQATSNNTNAPSGVAVTMQQRDNEEITSCINTDNGNLIWANVNAGRHETVLGGIGPRSTPTIQNGRVFALGAFGVLNCLDLATGNVIWSHDLFQLINSSPKEDASLISWGRSSSPLVVDGIVVVPLGGKPGQQSQSLIAFDAETGVEKWKAGNRQVSYSSPIVATLAGKRQIVIVTENNVEGYEISDGSLLWQYNDWTGFSNSRASTSQPVPISDTDILLTKGYGYGAARIRIATSQKTATPYAAEEIWTNPTVLKTKYTNVVIDGTQAIGLSDGVLQSVDLETGNSIWKKGRFGHGQILMVAGVLIVQDEDGPIHFLNLQDRGFKELAKVEAMSDLSWANLCLFDNKLLIRNSIETVCYELPLSRTND